jgi:hypothetical protein
MRTDGNIPIMRSFYALRETVKVDPCLTKLHVIKTYTLLNWARRHEDVLGHGGIAPHTHNLGTGWR